MHPSPVQGAFEVVNYRGRESSIMPILSPTRVLLLLAPLFTSTLGAQSADSQAVLSPRESVLILEARERLVDRRYEYDVAADSLERYAITGGPALASVPDSLGPIVSWQLTQRSVPCRKNAGAMRDQCPYLDVILVALVRPEKDQTGRLIVVPRTVFVGDSGVLVSLPPSTAVLDDADWAAKKGHGVMVKRP